MKQSPGKKKNERKEKEQAKECGDHVLPPRRTSRCRVLLPAAAVGGLPRRVLLLLLARTISEPEMPVAENDKHSTCGGSDDPTILDPESGNAVK